MDLERWNQFEEACRNCTKCGLAKSRSQVVLGRGVVHEVPVMMVGEGPRQQEDLTGKAFVGPAGALLDTLLTALRFDPDEWYIGNVVKCRPPSNREPSDEEAAACLPWLRFQVKALKPKVLVCLGRTAARHLVGRDIRITAARGKWVEKQGFWIMPTWHPAAVLRDATKKTDLFLDLEQVRKKLDELRSSER